jgi:hypothetical protein
MNTAGISSFAHGLDDHSDVADSLLPWTMVIDVAALNFYPVSE